MQDEQLEPPGTIAIIGAGPIGLEAALYARSLGYMVKVFEAGEIGEAYRFDASALLPEPFGRWRSPLGMAALLTQNPQFEFAHPEFPINYRDYIHQYLMPLAATDLLSDEILTGCRVVSLENEPFEATEADEEIPPADFIVNVEVDGVQQQHSFECVLDVSGAAGPAIEYPTPSYRAEDSIYPDIATGVPYLYRLGGKSIAGSNFLSGLEQIRRLFAHLYGREALDLYRTARF